MLSSLINMLFQLKADFESKNRDSYIFSQLISMLFASLQSYREQLSVLLNASILALYVVIVVMYTVIINENSLRNILWLIPLIPCEKRASHFSLQNLLISMVLFVLEFHSRGWQRTFSPGVTLLHSEWKCLFLLK